MREFWVASGHHLLDRDAGGGLVVTDEFLKVLLARPEVVPPPEACMAERALHAKLSLRPRAAVSDLEIRALEDADARENWELLVAFRDHLVGHPTIEAAYLALVRDGMGRTPPLFVNQLVHLILRNALDGEHDANVLRAGELFFRSQKLTSHGGTLLLADEETVRKLERNDHASPLVAMLGGAAVVEMEVLGADNAARYHARSDGHDFVLDFGTTRAGRQGFARVVERWVGHLLGVEVDVEVLPAIRDEAWVWFVGLDAEATRIGNAIWRGEAVEEDALERIVALFRLTFRDPAHMLPHVAGAPVYLILAVTPERVLRTKPQNLVIGLPVGQGALVN
jgi:hypothetical protein